MYNVRKGNIWQVRDKEGVIHDGPELEMRAAFFAMTTDDQTSEYYCEFWYPPLELVKVEMVAE